MTKFKVSLSVLSVTLALGVVPYANAEWSEEKKIADVSATDGGVDLDSKQGTAEGSYRPGDENWKDEQTPEGKKSKKKKKSDSNQ